MRKLVHNAVEDKHQYLARLLQLFIERFLQCKRCSN